MDSTAAPLQKLIEQFARLPGVGRKMAQRFAFYVLDLPEDKAKEFSAAILEAKSKIKKCSVCGNFTEGELCPICAAKACRKTSNPSGLPASRRLLQNLCFFIPFLHFFKKGLTA